MILTTTHVQNRVDLRVAASMHVFVLSLKANTPRLLNDRVAVEDHNLSASKGLHRGVYMRLLFIGVIPGDTRSLDYGSHGLYGCLLTRETWLCGITGGRG